MPPVPIGEKSDHGLTGEEGEVLDGLHPGEGPLSLQERVRPVPQTQLRLLNDLGVPSQHYPEVTHKVTWAAHTPPPLPPEHPN